MSIELKRCPFCGEKPEFRSYGKNATGYGAQVVCFGCNAAVSSATFCKTQQEADESAVEAWNRRAERTCRNLEKGSPGEFSCSACGYESGPDDAFYHPSDFRFCPCCGARLVDADE